MIRLVIYDSFDGLPDDLFNDSFDDLPDDLIDVLFDN
jgi:hypothetical protein